MVAINWKHLYQISTEIPLIFFYFSGLFPWSKKNINFWTENTGAARLVWNPVLPHLSKPMKRSKQKRPLPFHLYILCSLVTAQQCTMHTLHRESPLKKEKINARKYNCMDVEQNKYSSFFMWRAGSGGNSSSGRQLHKLTIRISNLLKIVKYNVFSNINC